MRIPNKMRIFAGKCIYVFVMRQGDNILVSVIIPAYNQGAFLAETLDCVLAQTYENWECIIVNDGSTDNTEDVALAYCAKDKRFGYVKKENGGLSSARNAGLDVAKGDYIQFLDSDDLIHPTKFEKQVVLTEEHRADVVVCHHTLFTTDVSATFDNEVSLAKYNLTSDGFLYTWGTGFVIAIHSGLFSHAFLTKYNLRFEERVRAIEDWMMWSLLAVYNAKFIEHSDVMSYYRVHSASMSHDTAKQLRSRFEAACLLYEELPAEIRKEFPTKMGQSWAESILKREKMQQDRYNQFQSSVDYKVGYCLLWPLHRISSLLKRLLRK